MGGAEQGRRTAAVALGLMTHVWGGRESGPRPGSQDLLVVSSELIGTAELGPDEG